jgi:hypothetical protein
MKIIKIIASMDGRSPHWRLSELCTTGPLITLCCQAITKITKIDASGQIDLNDNGILSIPISFLCKSA